MSQILFLWSKHLQLASSKDPSLPAQMLLNINTSLSLWVTYVLRRPSVGFKAKPTVCLSSPKQCLQGTLWVWRLPKNSGQVCNRLSRSKCHTWASGHPVSPSPPRAACDLLCPLAFLNLRPQGTRDPREHLSAVARGPRVTPELGSSNIPGDLLPQFYRLHPRSRIHFMVFSSHLNSPKGHFALLP